MTKEDLIERINEERQGFFEDCPSQFLGPVVGALVTYINDQDVTDAVRLFCGRTTYWEILDDLPPGVEVPQEQYNTCYCGDPNE